MNLKNPYHSAQFVKSAAKINQLPQDTGYEVAFAGRSNAGKSSALNCITGINRLARTSKTPGRTQLINLFSIDDDRRLVDLPGYGFAKVPQAMKDAWQRTLAQYLEQRQCLVGLILLMDIRHPLKELDQMMLHWAINRQLPVHILLTKADKLKRGPINQVIKEVKERYNLAETVSVQAFSSSKRTGVEEVHQLLNGWFELEND
jgi:GTP-binding protein